MQKCGQTIERRKLEMIVGVTGTTRGMTTAQKQKLVENLLGVTDLHHGDCVGSDADAHDLVRLVRPDIKITSHPPVNHKLRAFKQADFSWEPKPYLERNKDIARSCQALIATPAGYTELRRSGTWATVRYAVNARKPVLIIYPDGTLEKRAAFHMGVKQ